VSISETKGALKLNKTITAGHVARIVASHSCTKNDKACYNCNQLLPVSISETKGALKLHKTITAGHIARIVTSHSCTKNDKA